MKKKSENNTKITTTIYIKEMKDKMPPLLTTHGKVLQSHYDNIRKYIIESLKNQEFFNEVYGRLRFDFYNPQILLCVDKTIVIDGVCHVLSSDELKVYIPTSMDLFSKIIVYALHCGAYSDSDMSDHDKYLKYSLMQLLDKENN